MPPGLGAALAGFALDADGRGLLPQASSPAAESEAIAAAAPASTRLRE